MTKDEDASGPQFSQRMALGEFGPLDGVTAGLGRADDDALPDADPRDRRPEPTTDADEDADFMPFVIERPLSQVWLLFDDESLVGAYRTEASAARACKERTSRVRAEMGEPDGTRDLNILVEPIDVQD